MRSSFVTIFWGLIIVGIDITLDGFDFLVDGIGYLMIGAGCYGLSSWSPRFKTARTFCFILTGLWVISLGTRPQSESGTLLLYAMTAADLAMIWQLLGGINEMALANQRLDLAQRAHNRRTAYIVLIGGGHLLVLAASSSSDVAALIIPLAIATMVVMVMILHLIHRMKTEIAS